MHWFSQQLAHLQELAERQVRAKSLAVAGTLDPREADAARHAYFAALGELVQQMQRREGVEACFVCHEGLLIAKAGSAANFEALAAVAQQCLDTVCQQSASNILGSPRQMVVLGDRSKLALVFLGPIALGILSPLESNLSRSLSQ